jgi:hypothetical protein
MSGLSGSRASPDMVALLTSREETAELLKMKQSVATRSIRPVPSFQIFPARAASVFSWLSLCLRDLPRGFFLGSRYVDLIIPRGSNDFVQYVMRNTDIPVRDAAQPAMRRDTAHGGDERRRGLSRA